jgi:hypothetical protein
MNIVTSLMVLYFERWWVYCLCKDRPQALICICSWSVFGGLWHRLQQLQADGAIGAMTMVGYEQQPYEYISIYTTGFNLIMCSILHYE